MITRPLDLASRLRPPPRNFDALFYVNVGLLAVFFGVFGSRFVLAPGVGVDFRLPLAEGANASAKAPTHVISVLANGQIFTTHGARKLEEMPAYLIQQAKGVKDPVLLVRGDAAVPTSVLATIASAATRAKFEVVWAASEPAGAAKSASR